MEHVNQKRLFIGACLALLVTAITFAIRAKIEGVFTDDYGLSKEQVGRAFGPAFWGFAVAMFAGGYFIDIGTREFISIFDCVAFLDTWLVFFHIGAIAFNFTVRTTVYFEFHHLYNLHDGDG